ncbi:MAG: putative 2-dehydropantoate 2-reductase [Jaaginema sp. PMC 1079.18]|nr:putative 2-dehydropantoate 2-reductase [Jaaginema sp. PMC 1080.18]MEC4850864.1 putative 2-dehydropantoate 2-reductase [Jaaginema sp. PMC 1079.18]MEC4866264.1 putative 2-dehydropantoate 2-reductase [Jaaginema sp. PMC 1078.18]
MTRQYAIIGTGAIGGYYGALLQKAGFPVHFLLRSDYAIARDRGLTLQSINGDFKLPQILAYNDPAKMPPCDVILIALKATQNHLLPQILPPILHPNSIVILLQNGISTEPEIAKIPGINTIIGGICSICCYKIAPVTFQHLAYGEITLGEYVPNYQPCGITPILKQISADFQKAKISVETTANLIKRRWQKLVWNIPYNSLSVILDATTTELMEHPHSRQFIRETMQEVLLAATATHCQIADSYIQEMLDHTDNIKTPYLTSMKLDYNNYRPLEIEVILHNPLKIAQTANIELPKIRALYQQLKFLSDRHYSNS